MRADELFQYIAWAFYVLIFVIVARRAASRPTRANAEIALFFGDTFLIIALSTVPSIIGITPPTWLASLTDALLLSLPYLLLRLVASFSEISTRLLRYAEVGLALSIVAIVGSTGQQIIWLTLVMVAYFTVTALLASALFIREARQSGGVTRRRLQAVALGSAFIGVEILCVGLAAADPVGAPGASIQLWEPFASGSRAMFRVPRVAGAPSTSLCHSPRPGLLRR